MSVRAGSLVKRLVWNSQLEMTEHQLGIVYARGDFGHRVFWSTGQKQEFGWWDVVNFTVVKR